MGSRKRINFNKFRVFNSFNFTVDVDFLEYQNRENIAFQQIYSVTLKDYFIFILNFILLFLNFEFISF